MVSFSRMNWYPEAVKFSGLCLFTGEKKHYKVKLHYIAWFIFNIQDLFRLFSSKKQPQDHQSPWAKNSQSYHFKLTRNGSLQV